ncbi:MAG TPA: hypothetical protein VN107_09300 [Microbacterium sp.]|nr:hypothetical protein [Microbacterium sp.]
MTVAALATAAVIISSLTSTAAFAVDAVTAPADLAIAGDMTVGSTVSIPATGWSPGDAAVSVVWSVDGTIYTEPEGQAADLALRVEPDMLGKTISAEVTAAADTYDPYAQKLTATEQVAPGDFASAPQPVIVGTPKVDSPLSVSAGTWDAAATLTYAWTIAGTTVGTDPSFTPTAAQQGAALSVTVTGSADGYNTASRVSAAVTIGTATFTTKPVPTIVGAIRVGSRLTAKPGTWSPAASFSYSWKVSGVPVSTASTFTPAATQRGRSLTLTVSAKRAGYVTVTQTTKPITIGYGVFVAPTPKISGSAVVGSTLTANAGTWSPWASKSYRWLRNGVAITGATGASYKVTSTDWGKKISVRVTGTRAAYLTKTMTSASTAYVVKRFSLTTAPTITGTTRVNSILSAHRTAWSPLVSSYTWQWKRNGVSIVGATGSAYRLTVADYGKKITVMFTGRRGGYATTSRTSAATAAVIGPAPVVTKDSYVGYRVGTQIKAGTYYANAPEGCLWARLDSSGNPIGFGAAFTSGRQIVTIRSTDYGFGTVGCGSWTPLLKLTAPATTVGNGVQAVGTTMQAGHYVTTGPTGEYCYYEVLSGFGGTDAELISRWPATDVDSGASAGREVFLDSTTKGFASYDCGTWTRVGD